MHSSARNKTAMQYAWHVHMHAWVMVKRNAFSRLQQTMTVVFLWKGFRDQIRVSSSSSTIYTASHGMGSSRKTCPPSWDGSQWLKKMTSFSPSRATWLNSEPPGRRKNVTKSERKNIMVGKVEASFGPNVPGLTMWHATVTASFLNNSHVIFLIHEKRIRSNFYFLWMTMRIGDLKAAVSKYIRSMV